jgi:mono/diheme cytochrome c family protein
MVKGVGFSMSRFSSETPSRRFARSSETPSRRFARYWTAVSCVAFALLAGGGHPHPQAASQQDGTRVAPRLQPAHAPAPPVAGSASAQRALLDKYCVACHNERLRTAGLSLTAMNLQDVARDSEAWEKVVRKLRGEAMPPAGRPRPDKASYAALRSWLEAALDGAAPAITPKPRPFAAHRLNRVEYGNAVRDLLGVQIDAEMLLPPDDVSQEGFDNLADTLSVSSTLMERYMAASRRISQLAVGDPEITTGSEVYRVPESLVQDDRTSDDLPFGSRGGISVRHYFPTDGEYSVRIRLRRSFYDVIRGLGTVPHQLEVRVDGALAKSFSVGGEHMGSKPPASHSGNTLGDEAWETYSHHADDDLVARIPVKAGLRIVGVSFVRRPAVDEGVLQPPRFLASFGASTDEMMDGNPSVRSVEVTGPFRGTVPRQTDAREKIFVCSPAAGKAAEEERCARRIVSTLARRAYRRPVTENDVATLLGFYEEGRRAGGFDGGVQAALERMLVDPEFLFRLERAGEGSTGNSDRISDLELASRLSFFLWSSIPDEELLDAAVQGKLSDPVVLERQIRRMLADPRVTALVGNFAAQWLQLRHLRNATPDATVFPEFDENLREAMQKETQLFLESQLREDRSIVDLVRADYTFVNERLAQHYGVPNIYGNHFRRVTFRDGRRAGLLSQGSILTLTSYPNRTSPVLRGKWVLENILGSPPPPPPPDVPPLEESNKGGQPRSVREQMQQHRRNPACAGCHSVMDPLGFSLENFDAIGRWRTVDMTGILDQPPAGAPAVGTPIDASGALPDGTKFMGMAGLRQLLADREEEFVGTVAERLLMYALGRPVEHYDMPAVRQILRKAAEGGNRWSSLIVGIVNSRPFQARRPQS